MGRPSSYTPELGEAICDRVISRPLSVVCKDDDLPSRETVYSWLHKHKEFLDSYTRARKIRAYSRSDALDDIMIDTLAGNVKPDVARVLMDAIKWQSGKENSPVFGDRQVIAGDLDAPLGGLTDAQVDERLIALLAQAGKDELDANLAP